jgi:hypothetical protein
MIYFRAPIGESCFLFWDSKHKLLRKAGKWIPKMAERFAIIQKKSIRVRKFTFIVRKLKL